jgi:hypothetical protein
VTAVFISHAAADAMLAAAVGAALAEATPPLTTFVSSRPGDIRADAEWMPAVHAAILRGDTFLILLTPNSIGRPWVAFELGAAWFSQRPTVLARTSSLPTEEIPLPLSERQIYRLDQPDDASVIFHDLGTTLRDPCGFALRIQGIALPHLAGQGEMAWEGIVHDGQFYAWAGPLLDLEDREQVTEPPGLADELRRRGLRVRFSRLDRLSRRLGLGWAQVFATDRRSWRRAIASGDQVMLVTAAHGEGTS